MTQQVFGQPPETQPRPGRLPQLNRPQIWSRGEKNPRLGTLLLSIRRLDLICNVFIAPALRLVSGCTYPNSSYLAHLVNQSRLLACSSALLATQADSRTQLDAPSLDSQLRRELQLKQPH